MTLGAVVGQCLSASAKWSGFAPFLKLQLLAAARLAKGVRMRISLDEVRSIRVIFRSIMVPRMHSEDSDPVLEVSAIGMADSDGEYLQHDAVSPHKARSAAVDPETIVIRHEPVPPVVGVLDGLAPGLGGAAGDAERSLADATSMVEETTSITEAKLRANGWGLFRLQAFVETHRATTLMFVIGGLLLLLSAMLAAR
jgi:hypothetical protein